MSIVDIAYIELGKQILLDGSRRMDRTGTGTISIFGTRLDLDISREFPLLSTKKLGIKSIIHELLWFLAGNTNIKYLVDNGVHIWDAWADKDGECGPIYGNQWRAWPTSDGKTIDQIAALIASLKSNPYSRRHIVSAWNVALVDKMALPPCHTLFQFFVRQSTLAERIKHAKLQAEFYGTEEYGRALAHDPAAIAIINTALDTRGVPDKSLSCQLYQRSADYAIGIPYNLASYALLTMMVAQQVDMIPDRFVWVGGDTHLYANHIDKFAEQTTRDTLVTAPTMLIRKAPSIFEYTIDDFELVGYQPQSKIEYEISV